MANQMCEFRSSICHPKIVSVKHLLIRLSLFLTSEKPGLRTPMCNSVDAPDDATNKAATVTLPPSPSRVRPPGVVLAAPAKLSSCATPDANALSKINTPGAVITDLDLSVVSE
jgi:hypothetical protein